MVGLQAGFQSPAASSMYALVAANHLLVVPLQEFTYIAIFPVLWLRQATVIVGTVLMVRNEQAARLTVTRFWSALPRLMLFAPRLIWWRHLELDIFDGRTYRTLSFQRLCRLFPLITVC